MITSFELDGVQDRAAVLAVDTVAQPHVRQNLVAVVAVEAGTDWVILADRLRLEVWRSAHSERFERHQQSMKLLLAGESRHDRQLEHARCLAEGQVEDTQDCLLRDEGAVLGVLEDDVEEGLAVGELSSKLLHHACLDTVVVPVPADDQRWLLVILVVVPVAVLLVLRHTDEDDVVVDVLLTLEFLPAPWGRARPGCKLVEGVAVRQSTGMLEGSVH
mmetsp:Transcript_11039/g.17727  ORF Transcript_11039/g.17727 Transcript_11039/m.17727 type:complete len:217 (+) Transcript_11039:1771-2421(+)